MSFEPGAPAAAGFVPLCLPEVSGNEWRYIKECLDTGWVSSVGSYVDRFERECAARAGTRHAVATVNGTSALHIALLVAGVRPDDEVIIPTLTFIATANAVRYAGAWPLFMDAEPEHWQMDMAKLGDFLETGCELNGGELQNRATGRRVSAIMPVHILGHPSDMDPLLALARRFNLRVIEDATESIGAGYRGWRVGSLGDMACFSFNGNKVITTGGGGMICTDNESFAKKAKYLTTQAKDNPLEYVHNEVGYNYRLPNLLAAMGCAQLEQLDGFIARKRRIAARYEAGLRDVPGLRLPRAASWAESIWWLYSVEVDAAIYGEDSRALLKRLAAAQIQARPLWQPMHQSPAHAAAPRRECPVADRLHRNVLSLPSSAGLTEADQQRVVDCLRTRGGKRELSIPTSSV
jgi:perosamine synthetase